MSFRRALVTLLAAGLVLGPTVSAEAASQPTRHERSVIKAVNAERVERDRAALKVSSCLQKYASAWARTMGKRQSLAHRSSSSLRTIMSRCKLRAIGENIAYGYPNARRVTAAWMGSPGHRANILRSSYRLTGLGGYRDGDGRMWHAQLFGTAR